MELIVKKVQFQDIPFPFVLMEEVLKIKLTIEDEASIWLRFQDPRNFAQTVYYYFLDHLYFYQDKLIKSKFFEYLYSSMARFTEFILLVNQSFNYFKTDSLWKNQDLKHSFSISFV